MKGNDPLERMFQNHVSERYKDNLLKPIPGYPEAALNKLAQLWNYMNLSCATTLGSARLLALNGINRTQLFFSDLCSNIWIDSTS